MAKEKKTVNKKLITALVVLILGNVLFFLTFWLSSKYDNIYLDQILFQLRSPAVGANKSLLSNAYIRVGLFSVILTAVEILLYFVFSGKFANKLKNCERYVKYCATKACEFFRNVALPFALATLLVAVTFFVARLRVGSYIVTTSTESDFIESNYVDPNKTTLTFPQQKRNVIYIFLESMENTYGDTSAGGNITQNYIPELYELAENNINFSHNNGIGGALSYAGTTWTSAAMTAQTSGMLVKVPVVSGGYGGEDSFLSGITTIGEVLAQNGYNQMLLVGSDADFGGRKTYFTEHGNYSIVDINSLKAEGRLPQDYREWWGFEDKKVFQFAKEEITKLSQQDKPFNFTVLTADTHFPDGYICDICDKNHDEQYANVLSCASKQVYEFVNWIKEQPFYENTTVIISGDHLTMDPEFLKDTEENYTRTVYNCIINSAVAPVAEKNRNFGTFDMFPTTLAAMGVKIDGDRLGLGTNLFSASPTLTELYGFEMLDKELQKKSVFYNEEILELESIEVSKK
ncbi:MAG: LTA synthase family protein [Acutalibacteraceae bacterium]|nr:LTA synthase family protein [Acutalibacteraceae bacterium]